MLFDVGDEHIADRLRRFPSPLSFDELLRFERRRIAVIVYGELELLIVVDGFTFIGGLDKVFIIPPFQRNYERSNKQCEELFY